MNQLATPGLGSLMARRFAAGTAQLLVFLAGFALFVGWFVDEMRQFYAMMFSNHEPHVRFWLLWAGVGLAGLAWLWALFTSLNLLREAKRNEGRRLQGPG
jgi:hypothetical protein